jgi:hypothetical protein
MRVIRTVEKTVTVITKQVARAMQNLFATREKKEFNRLKDFLTL